MKRNRQCALLQIFVLVFVISFVAACFHENSTPIANAGKDQEVRIGTVVYLDATNSSDPNGAGLSYRWEFAEKPSNSAATLDNPNSAKPSFVADTSGTFILRLVVNNGKLSSKADTLHVMIINEPPIAKIESQSTDIVNERITLDASKSTDPELQPLYFSWTFSAKPKGSLATFANNNSVATSFIPDFPGYYVVKLGVRDGQNGHETSEIVMFEVKEISKRFNAKPFAEAGKDIPLRAINVNVRLDGSASYDLDNDPITFKWELFFKPDGSNAVLDNPNSVSPSFFADVTGTYVAKLVVSDIDGESHIDVVVITPHSDPQLACQDCHEGTIARTAKPQTHMITYDDCRQCHGTNVWTPAVGADHWHSHNSEVNVCVVCHNGVTAKATSTNHAVVKEDCNYCHTLAAWKPIIPNSPVRPILSHKGIYSGCLACHNGTIARGKPASHMPTSNRCNGCHDVKTGSWLSNQHVEHIQAFNQICNKCHS